MTDSVFWNTFWCWCPEALACCWMMAAGCWMPAGLRLKRQKGGGGERHEGSEKGAGLGIITQQIKCKWRRWAVDV